MTAIVLASKSGKVASNATFLFNLLSPAPGVEKETELKSTQ